MLRQSSQRSGSIRGVAWSIGVVALGVQLGGCAAPFSEMQSARLVGVGRVEATASYSRVSLDSEGSTAAVQNQTGVQVARGISPRMDLRARLEHVTAPPGSECVGECGSFNVLGFGPKFGLIENRVAFYVPVGFAFGGGIPTGETWQTHPTLLLTIPGQKVELNASLKALVPLNSSGYETLVAWNVGLGISPDLSRWAIRPEFGVLYSPGDQGHFRHFGIGVSRVFGK